MDKVSGEKIGKRTLTFLGTFNAAGNTVAPLIIYPYTRIPKLIRRSVPEGFHIGKSDSGWMKQETFMTSSAEHSSLTWKSITLKTQ